MDQDDPSVPPKESKLQPVQEKTANGAGNPATERNEQDQRSHKEKGPTVETPTGSSGKNAPTDPVSNRTRPASFRRPQMSRRASTHDKSISSPTAGAAPTARELPDSKKDQPLPPTPVEPPEPGPLTAINTERLPAPVVNVLAPTPTVAQKEISPTPEESPTDSKSNNDVEMPDAPVDSEPKAARVGDGSESSTAPRNTEIPRTDLPPPPPRDQRQTPAVPPTAALPSSPAGPSQEKQLGLLPPIQPHLSGRKCLVLDLDETLVHSSFKTLSQADFTIPVEIEGQYHNVYVIKRPGVDDFMKRVGELYEVVVFTASVSKYGDPLLDQLDIHHVVHHRLFRESCYNHQGNYVKVRAACLTFKNVFVSSAAGYPVSLEPLHLFLFSGSMLCFFVLC